MADTAALASERPSLPREASAHLKVLRPKDGEEIELFDGRGASRVYRWSQADGALSAASAPARLPRPAPLVLFACVTKGSRWDWTIEKATELGATRIVPVISERTIVRLPRGERAAKRERWTRIAEDAARQSDAAWIPEVVEPVDFADSLAMVAETDCYAGALTDPPPEPLLAALARRDAASGRPLALYVGPEGDFTPDELAALLKVATPADFGPTVLRAETAAIFALSVLAASRHASLAPRSKV
ncbi:MAG: 16S rRNA (uracil(1498)-N(3))-methyltransferase [Kiritimatiellae bacterium]|nr:16S rRNA (uracil(1498)-N(3))-methyltransferase [Kiritimatiellia bacterium]